MIKYAYGRNKFLKIAEDTGNLFMNNDRNDGRDFEFFYAYCKRALGESRVKNIEDNADNSSALKEFFRSVNEALKPVQNVSEKDVKPRLVREYASTNEVGRYYPRVRI